MALIILLLAIFLAGIALGALALVAAGIHTGSRSRRFDRNPRNHVEATGRQVLGVGIRSNNGDHEKE